MPQYSNYHFVSRWHQNSSYHHCPDPPPYPNSSPNCHCHSTMHSAVVSSYPNAWSNPKVSFFVRRFLFPSISKFLVGIFLSNRYIYCLLILSGDALFRLDYLRLTLVKKVSGFCLWIRVGSFILVWGVRGFCGSLALILIIWMFLGLLALIRMFCCHRVFSEIISFHLMSYLHLIF